MVHGIGLIGCGTHARHHAKHLGEHFELTEVWDPKREQMDAFLPRLHADSLEQLLSNERIDSVLICSPEAFHLEQIRKALIAGKHVFCEKPLMTAEQDVGDLEDLFDTAAARQLILSSCHPRRKDRPFLWLQDHLRSSYPIALGKVLHFDFDFSYHEPSSAWKHSRSLMEDHLNHEVDLMNFLFGINGFLAMKITDGHDHYEVAGKRDDGLSFRFHGSRRLPVHHYPEFCRVRFERGEVVLDMMMGEARILDHTTSQTTTIPELHIDYDGRLVGVMDAFADAIDGRSSGYLSREEMLMNTEAAIYLQGEGIQLQRIEICSQTS